MNVVKPKNYYLDPLLYHAEMVKCKKEDRLSDSALKMMKIHAEETCNKYYYEDDEDRKDAVARALEDLWKYWRGFKETNVIRFKILRNMRIGDKLKFNIHGHGSISYVAAPEENIEKGEFKIGTTVNYSLSSLRNVIRSRDLKHIDASLDKIKNVMTFMDKFNSDDLSNKSFVEIEYAKVDICDLVENKKYLEIGMNKEGEISTSDLKYIGFLFRNSTINANTHVFSRLKREVIFEHEENIENLFDPFLDHKSLKFFFKEPPLSFSYLSSIISNGALKSINKNHPKHLRNGMKISLSSLNDSKNGTFNF